MSHLKKQKKNWTMVYADAGDWEALYDEHGKLVGQGHSINLTDVLAYFGVEYAGVEAVTDGGTFSEHLEDVELTP